MRSDRGKVEAADLGGFGEGEAAVEDGKGPVFGSRGGGGCFRLLGQDPHLPRGHSLPGGEGVWIVGWSVGRINRDGHDSRRRRVGRGWRLECRGGGRGRDDLDDGAAEAVEL